MSSLLNLGVSGLSAYSQQLNNIGNNIANSGTAGYKRGELSFSEAFYSAGGRSPNGMMNQVGGGARIDGLNSDWSGGAIEDTGIETNLAISGDGFFPVQQNGATMYSRAGDFNWIDYGAFSGGAQTGFVLGRPNGALLLDSNLELLQFDAAPTSIEVRSDGTLSVEGAAQTNGSPTLGLQRFGAPNALKKGEGGLYESTSQAAPLNTPALPGTSGTGTLRQGAIERSNVDMVKELTSLISAQRAFQANSRTVTTADTILQEILGLKR